MLACKREDGKHSTRILYRCELGKARSVPIELAEHPRTVYLREEQVTPQLDAWIVSLADPDDLAREQVADPVLTGETAQLRRQLTEAEHKVAALITAIESGVAVEDIGAALRRRSAERDELRARLRRASKPNTLTAAQVASIAEGMGGLARVLREATASERAEVYASLGLRLDYDPAARRIKATADLSRVAGRVRGGISPSCPRSLCERISGFREGRCTGGLLAEHDHRRADRWVLPTGNVAQSCARRDDVGMAACEFCAIVAGLEPAEMIWQDHEIVAFFPLAPATPGHTLIIPKRHVSDFLAPEVDDLNSALGAAATLVGRAIRTALRPEGMNLITSSGEAATQTVFHLHIHLVPRWRDDKVGRIWPPEQPVSEERKEGWADRIRAQLAATSPPNG